jgi:Bax protein
MTASQQRLVLALVGCLVAALFAIAWRMPPFPATASPRAVLDMPPSVPVALKPPLVIVEILPDLTRRKTTASMVTAAFGSLGYDFREVLAGDGEVRRVLLTRMPADLPDIPETALRKTLFLQAVLPLVLQVNDEILAERRRLWTLRYQMQLGKPLAKGDRLWLALVAERYEIESEDIDELLRRVDVIPPSLALAQAAEESGWGSSRFVREGNALFGQWTFAKNGHLVPLDRAEDKEHRVKAFDSLIDSVRAYALNLNSHRAYRGFRAQREELRAKGAALEGRKLVSYLNRYSQRGPDYVRTIRTLIARNGLSALDGAKLRDEPPIAIPAI